MTGLDTRLVPRIKKILDKYGKTVTFVLTELKMYSVEDGTTTRVNDDEISGKITPPEPWRMAPLPGSTVQEGDMSTYVAASGLTFTPDVGLKVSLDGRVWEAVAVGRVYTGDLVGMYLLQLRS